MSWLHTYAGLLFGWILYFIFITGTTGYLDTEIDRWMRPEAPAANFSVSLQTVAKHAKTYLDTHAPGARRQVIGLPLDRNQPYTSVFWQGAQGEGVEPRGHALLNPETGETIQARETGAGQLLYRMHWNLHYLPSLAGHWLVGLATMVMLLALVTGIIVHKKIFADFFTFRRKKGARSWLDAHTLVSVATLPFQLMITYSGLIFMMLTYMPLITMAWYGQGQESRQMFFDEVYEAPALVQASGESAPLVSLNVVIAQAQRLWNEAPIAVLDMIHPNDRNARIVVRGNLANGPLRATHVLVFDGVSGKLLAQQPALHSNAKGFNDVMQGLHEGLFADPVLRILYVLSGLLGAAMVATGLVLWTVKRRQKLEKLQGKSGPGLRLVEKLNVGVVVGLPIAICAYFWANRLLPVSMPGRADWEVHVMFLTWLTMLIHAAFRSTKRAW
ncbi:MAG TPA: hypothetical protein DIS96_00005, partial [Pusillimonas sp.]|nr:hypothetical protein [Pusillimonas sp.]